MTNTNNTVNAKPFLRWAGGKTQLLNEIEKRLPEKLISGHIDTYVEPFIGGGAVMFWLIQKYPHIRKVIINDLNSDLINTYKVVKYAPLELIASLNRLQEEYYSQESMMEKKQLFLRKRDQFNSQGGS